MGLIKWVKDQYYNNQLKKADNKVSSGQLNEAEMIYTDILGKQEWAVVHLVKMLRVNADTVEKQLHCLNRMSELAIYKTEENSMSYQDEINSHLVNMEKNADIQFNQKNYNSAKRLIVALANFLKGQSFKDKLHRYKAYDAYVTSKNYSYTSCRSELNTIVEELNLISSFPKNDILQIKSLLCADSQYARAIILLLPFEGKAQEIEDEVISCIISIILSKDKDVRSIKSISNICSSSSIAQKAAIKLATLSNEAAKKLDYKTCVLYDKYAADYLSNDNSFNNNRCTHLLENISSKATASEIKKILSNAKQLGLSETQINTLIARIKVIANQTEASEAILICKLFVNDEDFGKIYLSKALELCQQQKESSLDKYELLRIIKSTTLEIDYPYYLGKFVNYFNEFDDEFFSSSIAQIIKNNDTRLLKKYWNIKPSSRFFEKLVSTSVKEFDVFVSYIIENHNLFLKNKTFKQAFCSALCSINDEEYILNVSEILLKNACDIRDFYRTTILKYTNEKDGEEAIALLNHALTILNAPEFIKAKKIIIRRLISTNKYELAEQEAESLIGIDEESWTLLSEVYFANAKVQNDSNIQIELFEKIIKLNSSHNLHSEFKPKLEATFDELTRISISLFDENQHDKAYSICDYISCNQAAWLNLYILLRNKEGEVLKTIGKKIKHIEDTLEKIKSSVEIGIAASSEKYNNLWHELSSLNIEKSKSQPKNKAIENLDKLRTNINTHCGHATKLEEVNNLTSLIVKLKWSYALDLEHENAYDNAVAVYESTANEHVVSYQKRALFRSLICRLKGNNLDANSENSIKEALKEKSYEALREDIAYRYVCYLIKDIRPADAEDIINKYLPGETDLLDLCKNLHIKEAEKCLAEFNEKVKMISNGTLSTNEAINFFKEIDNYKSIISSQLTDTSAKFSKYKIQVKAYIIKSLFNDENYEGAFKILKRMHPKFIDNEVAFRNIAVASIGIIESEASNDTLLRTAISIALSAVYTDKLFVNSLDQTSWDDQFEFTLDESLGHSTDEDYEELPENVNFDSPIDNQIVSIKDVQNNLLTRIETAIRSKHDSLESFYQNEKDALDQLLALNLDEHCYIATPGFATTDETIQTNIKEALDYEYNQGYGNQEDVLVVGLKYSFRDGKYYTYELAIKALEKCKQALSSTNSTTLLKTAFSSSNVTSIKEYDKLFSDLQASCSNAMNNSIRAKMAYGTFLDYYEIVCKAVNDIRMSMSCANYINGEIVQRLNNKTMKLREGISYMVRIYNLAPSNVQVKNNLEGILGNLIHEAEESNSTLDRNALNQALRDTNGVFNSKMELPTIIAKLEFERIEAYVALQQLYTLYTKQPSNDEVCEVLATIVKVCIHKYIIDTGIYKGKSEVRTVLNRLKVNKSSTFKKHGRILAAEYLQIMAKLPDDSRFLLMTGLELGSKSLNANGLALKEGLDFMKDLGDVNDLIKNRH
mgnify:FL=1